jgi:hypothetical protein
MDTVGAAGNRPNGRDFWQKLEVVHYDAHAWYLRSKTGAGYVLCGPRLSHLRCDTIALDAHVAWEGK